MDTINYIGDFIMGFILNWTVYVWSIPTWFIGGMILVKYAHKQVVVEDLTMLAILSVLNPLWHLIIFSAIISFPILLPTLYLIANWDDVKSKKVF